MHGVVPDNQLIEWEFYENVPVQEIPKTNADYLIFTSPSNANAYLDLHDLHDLYENQVVVAIGKSTYAALKNRGVLNEICAEHPVEEWIWAAILKMMSNE